MFSHDRKISTLSRYLFHSIFGHWAISEEKAGILEVTGMCAEVKKRCVFASGSLLCPSACHIWLRQWGRPARWRPGYPPGGRSSSAESSRWCSLEKGIQGYEQTIKQAFRWGSEADKCWLTQQKSPRKMLTRSIKMSQHIQTGTAGVLFHHHKRIAKTKINGHKLKNSDKLLCKQAWRENGRDQDSLRSWDSAGGWRSRYLLKVKMNDPALQL